MYIHKFKYTTIVSVRWLKLIHDNKYINVQRDPTPIIRNRYCLCREKIILRNLPPTSYLFSYFNDSLLQRLKMFIIHMYVHV
jgi:hypothetical protein